ncbi:MAG: hypothetical protein JNL13_12015 [Chitinophagaceae bacterium]|nr:hypothetical protein [Chitinophagaceae bacterium]
MIGMKKITTRTQEMVLDEDGIVCCRVLEGAQIDLEDAKENVLAVKLLAPGRRVPIYVDASGSRGGSKAARDYFASEEVARIQTACAFLVTSPLSSLIGNFFLGLNKTKFPFRLFQTEAKAKEWLKNFL